MIVQLMRSKNVNMDGRWWFGVKRWPSHEFLGELEKVSLTKWTMPRPWFVGLGPVQVRIWPGIKKQPDAAEGATR